MTMMTFAEVMFAMEHPVPNVVHVAHDLPAGHFQEVVGKCYSRQRLLELKDDELTLTVRRILHTLLEPDDTGVVLVWFYTTNDFFVIYDRLVLLQEVPSHLGPAMYSPPAYNGRHKNGNGTKQLTAA